MTDQTTQTRWTNGQGAGPGPGGRYPGSTPPWYVAIVAVILLTIVALLVILLLRDSDDQEVQTLPSTETSTTAGTDPTVTTTVTTATETTASTETSSTTSTTASTTSTSDPSSSTSVPTVDFIPAVWPTSDSSTRYDDPVDAASGFAVDFVGFTDPIIGPFLEGDGRSGEVEIRPVEEGPITVVLLRQVTDDESWWVTGSVTANIELDEPDPLDELASPLVLTGRALAFEGVVEVELVADGASEPLATGSVIGGGGEMAPFDGSFEFELPDEAGGAVILRTDGGQDDRVWEASVTRVRFPLAE